MLEFSSPLDVDRLNRAFVILVVAFPILSCVVQVEGACFHRQPVPDYRPAATVAGESDSGSGAGEAFTGAPCDPEGEPPLKLHLIRAAGRDTLCFKADHVLTDAAGLKQLLYALAEA